jgi:primosomal protein N''
MVGRKVDRKKSGAEEDAALKTENSALKTEIAMLKSRLERCQEIMLGD